MRYSFLCAVLALASPAAALTPDEIESAAYEGGVLPDGQSGLTVKVQVLLDRAGVSPGVIDGYKGGMSESALRGFEQREGFTVDGILDPDVWAALGGDTAGPILTTYNITEDDVSGLTESIPDHVADKAAMDRLGYVRTSEKLAERFHMDEDFLIEMNAGSNFAAGNTITVTDPGPRIEGTVARIEIRKSERRAVAFDEAGAMIVNYPVAIGSASTPSPSGTVEVVAIALEPNYSYNPSENFVADGVTENLLLPPGANGPVGLVWIDLSKPTYGLHGTASPSELFQNESHGCVRFTNWDAEELAHLVQPGVTVEFVE